MMKTKFASQKEQKAIISNIKQNAAQSTFEGFGTRADGTSFPLLQISAATFSCLKKGHNRSRVPQILWTGITPSFIWVEIRYPGTETIKFLFDLSCPSELVVVEHALAERGLCLRSGDTITPVTIEWPERAQEGARLIYSIWLLTNTFYGKA